MKPIPVYCLTNTTRLGYKYSVLSLGLRIKRSLLSNSRLSLQTLFFPCHDNKNKKNKNRPSFPPWTCELCSQEMNCITGNFTKYLKSINIFDLFLSFFRWNVLGISANSNFWCIFSCIKQRTSSGRQKKKTPWTRRTRTPTKIYQKGEC